MKDETTCAASMHSPAQAPIDDGDMIKDHK